jgi:glycosyltransferase involved in cell wall biosynthesis
MLKISPKVCVCLPVYNGASLCDGIPFIYRSINSILSQTFTDFELLISDNASDDSTPKICKEFLKKDKRIKYFRHNTNLDWIAHWKSVLEKTNCEYFVYHSHDDTWDPTFLEKNIAILGTKKNIIASFGKSKSVGPGANTDFKLDPHDNLIKFYYKKMRLHFRNLNDIWTITGSYEKRIDSCLHQRHNGLFIYSVFKTKILRKAEQIEKFTSWDRAVIIKSLNYGGIYLIDEILNYRYVRNDTDVFSSYKNNKVSLFSTLFPQVKFTLWCYRNLSKKRFFKNINYFIKLNMNILFPILIVPLFQKFHK